MSEIFYTFLSITVVSLISLIGILVFLFKKEISETFNLFLIGLAIGGLLAGAFVHLLPETYHALDEFSASILLLAGIIVFFLVERFLHWKLRDNENGAIRVFGPINLIADFFHNFLDGILIAVAFSMDIHVGIAATLAIILHEIPQELGDYGVLLKAGYSSKRALLFNFYSALSAYLGAFLIILIPKHLEKFIPYLYPLTIAAFVYLALNNLMPILQKHNNKKQYVIQFAGILIGMLLLVILFATNGEQHHHHHHH